MAEALESFMKRKFLPLLTLNLLLTISANAMTINEAQRKLAASDVGICFQTINHEIINSFKELNNSDLKDSCPNFKIISDNIGALNAASPSESELESAREKRVATGHAPIDRCLDIANPDITNWSEFIKSTFSEGNYKTGSLSAMSIIRYNDTGEFSAAGRVLEKRLSDLLGQFKKDKELISRFSTMCEDARKLDPTEIQARLLEINSEWNNLCGITDDIIKAKIKTTSDGYIDSIGEGALMVKTDAIKDPRCKYSFNAKVRTAAAPPGGGQIPSLPNSEQKFSKTLNFCFLDPASEAQKYIQEEYGNAASSESTIEITDIKFTSQTSPLNDYATDELLQVKKLDQVTPKKSFSELDESELLIAQKGHVQMIENRMRRCMAYVALTNHRYKKAKAVDLETTKLRPNVTTFDNKITCMDTTAQAIDYDGCANFVEEYNYTELIRLGEQTATQIITKNAMMEAQLNADPTDPAYLLRQQLEVVQGEASAAKWAQIAHYARAAALEGWLKHEFPSSKKLVTDCKSALDPAFSEKTFYEKNENLQKHYPVETNNSALCEEAMSMLTLLPNQEMRNRAHGLAALAGAEGLVKTANWLVGENNAKKLQDAIDDIDVATEKVEVPDYFTELKLDVCASNPESEQCEGAVFRSGVQMVNPIINTGSTVHGISEDALKKDETESLAKKEAELKEDLASTVSPSSLKKVNSKSAAFGAPAAAKMVSGARVSQGSGPAGGGNTGVSTRAANGAARSSGANTSAINGAKKYKFRENDSNTLRFSGGTKSAKSVASSKTRKNPLSKLLKGPTNKTRKFARAAASIGQKKGSLFNQISDRYIAVNNKKRLIEYVQR